MEKKINLPEGVIGEEALLTLRDFCTICGAEEQYVIEMVEMGILEPEGEASPNWQFSLVQMLRFRKAQRLRTDLKLNLQGVALSLELLDEIKQLRQDINLLEHQLKLLTQY